MRAGNRYTNLGRRGRRVGAYSEAKKNEIKNYQEGAGCQKVSPGRQPKAVYIIASVVIYFFKKEKIVLVWTISRV